MTSKFFVPNVWQVILTKFLIVRIESNRVWFYLRFCIPDLSVRIKLLGFFVTSYLMICLFAWFDFYLGYEDLGYQFQFYWKRHTVCCLFVLEVRGKDNCMMQSCRIYEFHQNLWDYVRAVFSIPITSHNHGFYTESQCLFQLSFIIVSVSIYPVHSRFFNLWTWPTSFHYYLFCNLI